MLECGFIRFEGGVSEDEETWEMGLVKELFRVGWD